MTVKALTLAALICCLAGCGGHAPAVQHPVSTQVPTLTANMVFQNIPQVWEFVSNCSNLNSDGSRGPVVEAHTWINVMPVDATHTIWHYTKDQPCAYWMRDGISAELYFFLEQDSTGAWYSTGGHIIAPFGFPWDSTHMPQDLIYGEVTNPGMPRPYLIVPAQSNGTLGSIVTTVPDTQGPNTPWETDWLTVSASTTVYTGYFMESHQKEGTCPICADESWLLAANGSGLAKITVYNSGSGPIADPLVLLRIH